MKISIIQHNNFWDTDKLLDLALSGELNFNFIPGGTTGNLDYAGMAHTLVDRVDIPHEDNDKRIASPYWESHFGEVFYSFTEQYNIDVKRVCRAAVNITTYDEKPHGEPHIDHFFYHKLFLLPLNQFDNGETIIFDKEIKDGDPAKPCEVPPIKYSLKNEKGKALCFDGNAYHANVFPAPGQYRMMLVVSFY